MREFGNPIGQDRGEGRPNERASNRSWTEVPRAVKCFPCRSYVGDGRHINSTAAPRTVFIFMSHPTIIIIGMPNCCLYPARDAPTCLYIAAALHLVV